MHQREYRYIVGRLRKHDSRFEIHVQRGKGGHRMVFHPDVEGSKRHYPLPYHGSKTRIAPGMQKDLVRIFQLPEDIFDGGSS